MSQRLETPTADAWGPIAIIQKAQQGRLLIPTFQRQFRWKRPDILALFDSLYKGYPIGNLLVWDTERFPATQRCFGPLSFEKSSSSQLLIIDGQQRITTLVAVLLGGGKLDPKFQLYFDLSAEEFKHAKDSSAPPNHWLPLAETADTARYLRWLRGVNLGDLHIERADRLVKALRDYRLPVYIVHADDDGQIREVFRRLNSTGRRLTEAEIFHALHGGRQLDHLVKLRQIANEPAHASPNFGELNDTWLLKSFAATLDFDRGSRLSAKFADMNEQAQSTSIVNAGETLRRVIDFLRQNADVPHWSLLPYRFPIIALSAFFARYPNANPATRQRLSQWLWRGAATGAHASIGRPVIRAVLDLIKDAETDEQAAKSLCADMANPGSLPELTRHDFSTAKTKIACLILARQQPRDVVTGELFSVNDLLQTSPARAVRRIVWKTGLGSEARLLHRSLAAGDVAHGRRLKRGLLRQGASSELLGSHLISATALSALREGRNEDFLQARGDDLLHAMHRFLRAKTHW